MKVFLQTLLPKSGRAGTPDSRLGGAKADEKTIAAAAAPQKPEASGKSAPPGRGEENAANGRLNLALEAGDFIDRIPHHLLKFGSFDLHRPLLFDMGEIANRIARGIFTIPLADLLKAIPEMFADHAQTLHALEIRFPWQKVMQMVNESAEAQKENGGETLAQKLRRMRKIDKPAAPVPQEAPLEPRRAGNIKRGAGRDGESAWFSKRAITFEGTTDPSKEKTPAAPGAETPKPPEVPESAPALFELPTSNGANVLPAAAPPAAAPIASPAPNAGPVPDLMDMGAEPPPPATSGTAGAGFESREPVPALAANSAKSGLEESEQKMNRTRIKFLEAQLKTLSAKHQDEVAMLKEEADRMIENARVEKEKERLELVAQFQFERQQLAVAKNEQLARLEAEYRAGVAAQQNQISELRASGEKAPDGERRKSVSDCESGPSGSKALEARLATLTAELEFVKLERDQAADSLLLEEQRTTELEARLEFDLFALRVESAQIVAAAREDAGRDLSEARAALERERQQVIAERQQILREMTARAETSVLKKDEPLDRLQAELERVQALAAAQAEAHERVAAQWEEDIQAYRKRIQLVIGERTALAAKLREAEIALQAAGGAVAGTAA